MSREEALLSENERMEFSSSEEDACFTRRKKACWRSALDPSEGRRPDVAIRLHEEDSAFRRDSQSCLEAYNHEAAVKSAFFYSYYGTVQCAISPAKQ